MPRTLACGVNDISPGSAMTIKGLSPAVALFQSEDGEYFATQDMCSHEDWSLGDDSDVEGCEVVCPLHMARFDLRTGEPLSLPATDALKTYPVEVENGEIYIVTE